MLRWMGRSALLIVVLGSIALLVERAASPPTLDEVMGTYQLSAPGIEATLTLRSDGHWDYELLNQRGFRRSGRWERHPKADSSSTLAIILKAFDLGFAARPRDRIEPTNYFLNLEIYRYANIIRSCLDETYQRCFKKPR